MENQNFLNTTPQPLKTESTGFADTVQPDTSLPKSDSEEYKDLVIAQANAKTLPELLETLHGYTGIPLSHRSLAIPDIYNGNVLGSIIAGENKAGESDAFNIPTLPDFNKNLQRILKNTPNKSSIEKASGIAIRSTFMQAPQILTKVTTSKNQAATTSPLDLQTTPITSDTPGIATLEEKPKPNGFFRAIIGSVADEKNLLSTQQRAGIITADEYFKRITEIDERQATLKEVELKRKKVSTVNKPSFFTRVKARLKGAFSTTNRITPTLTHESRKTELKLNTIKNLSKEEVDAAIAKDLQNLRKNNLEQKSSWKNRLAKVSHRTNTIFETTTKELGPAGNKLVSLLTQGAEYLNNSVGRKTKLFTAVGILTAGALAAYATPLILTALGTTSLAMRIVSAAGFYIFLRKQLDKKYAKWEKEGLAQSALAKAGKEAGAIGCALFGGEIIGKGFEWLSSLEFTKEAVTSLKNSSIAESATETWSNLFNNGAVSTTPSTAEPVAQIPTTSTPEAVISTPANPVVSAIETIAPPDPSLIHTVVKNDSLWSLLRKDLTRLDFEGFNQMMQSDQEKMIQEFVNKIDVPSGSKDLIRIHDKIDFNKYFRK